MNGFNLMALAQKTKNETIITNKIPKSSSKKAGNIFNSSKSVSHTSSVHSRPKATTEYQKSRNNSSYILETKSNAHQSLGTKSSQSKKKQIEVSSLWKAKRKPPHQSQNFHYSKMNSKHSSSKKKGKAAKSTAEMVKPKRLDQQMLDMESGKQLILIK